MSARSYLRVWLATLLALLGAAGLANFVVDPLQVFRRASFYTPHFSDNERYQVPGLARHYTAPVVVLGTSHMENASPAEIQAAFGEPGLKLAIAGSSLTEQQLALSIALESGKVRRVLWGIDYSALAWGDKLVDEWGEFPVYLYQRDPRLVSRYLLALQTLQDSRAALTEAPRHTLESLNVWWPQAHFQRERVLAAWTFQEGRWTPELRARSAAQTIWTELAATLERRVFATIRAHPQVHFELMLPPYSILAYANDFRLNDEWFFQRMLMREALRQFARQQANVRLWDFQTEIALSTRLERYKDLEHFDLEATRMMLKTVAGGTGAVADFDGADPLPRQVAEYLRSQCAGRGDAALCTAHVRCGATRLEAWLATGGIPERALEFAHQRCPG
jgi:ketosteroid isomerase-like protein